MLFNSPLFLFCFLPITYIVYHVFLRSNLQRAHMVWLVIASLFFYSWWNIAYLPLILASIVINHRLSFYIHGSPPEKKKIKLIVGVFFNLVLIGYFKYANFLVENIEAVFVLGLSLQQIILPLAISFYTFQQVAYLVDVYRGELPEKSLLNYCLYVTFFPQLIAGPIVRSGEMLPQFQLGIAPNFYENTAKGTSLFIVGLFKKIVIADSLSLYVGPIFTQAENGLGISFSEAWIAAVAYSLQLYFDFSGYSDMALGLALLFGIQLPVNFYSPYKARSIIEFWRCWHITLSRFLKDYLYIALGGNRFGSVRRYSNLLLTMVIGGLWHGASWNFVLWGLVHGVFLVVNNFWRQFCLKWLGWMLLPSVITTPLSIASTFLLVTLAWVIFRAETMLGVENMFTAMFALGDAHLPKSWIALSAELSQYGANASIVVNERARAAIDFYFWLLLLGSLIVLWCLPNTAQIFGWSIGINKDQQKSTIVWSSSPFWLFLISFMLIISIEKMNSHSEFLYFQF